ncbi:MAG: lipocalin family protein, partial [Povalibacter sp.]
FDLSLQVQQPPLLNGRSGFSQKSADAANASYYYSVPQLQVSGTVVVGKERVAVTGTAWLDHEWSTAFLDPRAQGWDWIGLNLDDGGALMASRIRRADGTALWSFASLRESSDAATQTFEGDAITWTPGRSWRSVRTGITYPVEWSVQVGGRSIRLVPLMDDQESDTRSSTGTIYWEGAVRALDYRNQAIGRGYLELTGYGARLKM